MALYDHMEISMDKYTVPVSIPTELKNETTGDLVKTSAMCFIDLEFSLQNEKANLMVNTCTC